MCEKGHRVTGGSCMAGRLLYQYFGGRVIENVAFAIDDAVLAMGGKWIKRHIGDDTEVWLSVLERTHCPLSQAIGVEGFLWNFLQGWWYRTLVDAKIYEIKKACGKDRERIKAYLKESYSISL